MLAHLLLTFRHRAGVRPYTSSCDFAEPCVFSKQSPPPSLCHPRPVARTEVTLIPKLRVYFAEFLQHRSLKRLGMLYQSTCVGLGYGLTLELFPGTSWLHPQSNKRIQLPTFVTSSRPRNINLVPIDYGFRPRLRGRLTLRRLALHRNPWTFGGSVSHTPCRYSCQHSHFRYLQHTSRYTFTGLRNAPLLLARKCKSTASVHILSPGTFSAQDGLFRPVSCYAFFKGWLLLSQPPGCLGFSTSFPT